MSSPGQLYLRVSDGNDIGKDMLRGDSLKIKVYVDRKKKPSVSTIKAKSLTHPQWNQEFVIVIPSISSIVEIAVVLQNGNKKVVLESTFVDWASLPGWEPVTRKIAVQSALSISIGLQYCPMKVPPATPASSTLPPFRIALERTKYHPGESVRGVLIYNVSKRHMIHTIHLCLEGFAFSSWFDENTDSTYISREDFYVVNHTFMGSLPTNKRMYKRYDKMLKGNNDDKEIYLGVGLEKENGKVPVEVGTHYFPFQYTLPASLPHSVSFGASMIGTFYFIFGSLILEGGQEYILEEELFIYPTKPSDLPDNRLVEKSSYDTFPISKKIGGTHKLGDDTTAPVDGHMESKASPRTHTTGGSSASSSSSSVGSDILQAVDGIDLDADAGWVQQVYNPFIPGFDGSSLKVNNTRNQSPNSQISPLIPDDSLSYENGSSNSGHKSQAYHPHHHRHLSNEEDHNLSIESNTHHEGDNQSYYPEETGHTPPKYGLSLSPSSIASALSSSSLASAFTSRSRKGPKSCPISLSAWTPSVGLIGEACSIHVTIENRSSKPITSLRLELRSKLHVNGYRNGKEYHKLKSRQYHPASVWRHVETELPGFPVKPGFGWKGDVEIRIPHHLEPSLSTSPFTLAYEIHIEARTSSKTASWDAIIPLVSLRERSEPIVSKTASQSEALLLPQPHPALWKYLIAAPIREDGVVPSIGFPLKEKLFSPKAHESAKRV